MDLRWSAR